MSSPAFSLRSPHNLARATGYAFSPWAFFCMALQQTSLPATKNRPEFSRKRWQRQFLVRANICFGRSNSVAEVTQEIATHSAEETIAWGREFAKRVQAPLM